MQLNEKNFFSALKNYGETIERRTLKHLTERRNIYEESDF